MAFRRNVIGRGSRVVARERPLFVLERPPYNLLSDVPVCGNKSDLRLPLLSGDGRHADFGL
jgi:hypothetical protein